MNENYSNRWGWTASPFVLNIDPSLFTGYEEQVNAIKNHIDSKHKIALITGPTGAGKTTFLKWIEFNHTNSHNLYISKPPHKAEEFIGIFTDTFGIGFFDKILRKYPTLFNLPNYVNKKLNNDHLVILLDESHETNKEVLEWLRVLVDQIKSVSLIITGMPVLETKIKSELETLNQRITTRVQLTALSESETSELISKRIGSVGGKGTAPFTENAIKKIYHVTGGFPREVLKLCDKLANDAIKNNKNDISEIAVEEYREIPQSNVRVDEPTVLFSPKPPSQSQISSLPYKQRRILEVLAKQDWLTPTTIVDETGLETYKSKGHAIRSINNILHRLMMEGFVQREARGKAFMYSLTPKLRTLFVEK